MLKNYEKAKQEYQKLLQDREVKIKIEVIKAKEEITKASNDSYTKAKASDKKQNEAPCSVCKESKFILKFRDVNGTIKGRINGSFSLFGGSISGYIDGETHTDPVLCCRNCENERKIVLNDWSSEKEIWFGQLPCCYQGTFSDYPPKDWLKEKGLEVARIIDNDYFHEYDSNDLDKLTDKELGKLGLINKFPLPKKPKRWDYTVFS